MFMSKEGNLYLPGRCFNCLNFTFVFKHLTGNELLLTGMLQKKIGPANSFKKAMYQKQSVVSGQNKEINDIGSSLWSGCALEIGV
jgi:hypothetical protein